MKKALKYIGITIGGIFLLFVLLIIIAIATPTNNTPNESNSSTVESQSSEPEQSESSESEFIVEHDQEYLDTRNYIWEFLIDKGYDVQTIIGVPNIGRTDADLGENYEGWYAFVKYNDEWTEFSVVLYNGEVAAIQPQK